MAAGDRIKTKEALKDIKTINRKSLLSEKIRAAAVKSANTVESVSGVPHNKEKEKSVSPEVYAVDDFSSAAGRVAVNLEGTFYTSKSNIETHRKGKKNQVFAATDIKSKHFSKDSTVKPIKAKKDYRTKPFAIKDKNAKAVKLTAQARAAKLAAKQGRRLAQVKAVTNTAKVSKSIKRIAVVLMKIVRSIIAAARSVIMLLMAGGWVVLLILIVMIIAAALASSIVGIFLSNDRDNGGMTTREAIGALGEDFSERILEIEESNPHDILEIVYTGGISQIDWKRVLSVYVANVNQRNDNPMEVIFFDEKRMLVLSDVLYDMNKISYEIKRESQERTVIRKDEDGKLLEEIETVTITTLRITVTQKTPDEMVKQYGFSDNQKKALAELLSKEYEPLWEELLGGFVIERGMGVPSKDRIPTGLFTWPLEYSGVITSYFGWREDPFTGETVFHSGIDIGAAIGRPILSAADGVVTTANGNDLYGGSWGYHVKINHAGGYDTLYAHCSAIAVRTGDRVKQGQVIAYTGNTGRSKGPHLHWEVYYCGIVADPLSFFQ